MHFDPETTKAMGLAFEKTCHALELKDQADPITELIAKRIIELAQRGERDSDVLCAETVASFNGPEIHLSARHVSV